MTTLDGGIIDPFVIQTVRKSLLALLTPKVVIVTGARLLIHLDPIRFFSFNLRTLEGESFMFNLPDDQAPAPYAITEPHFFDVEGNELTTKTESFDSSDPTIVAVNPDDPANPTRSGNISFGSPGVCKLTYKASIPQMVGGVLTDVVVIMKEFDFTITTGAFDPTRTTGGDVTFTGITETP